MPQGQGTPDGQTAWIRLDATERARYQRRTGIAAAALVGLMVVAVLVAPPATRWWWGTLGAVFVVVVSLNMYHHATGATLLTAAGMEFHTVLGRRFVPWSEIAAVQERRHTTRGGTYWQIHLIQLHGRTRTVPGAHTSTPDDPGFARKLALIHDYRARATGR
ncbi:hypothetical protein MTQ10_05575 [Streptomyces sp. XM83C]|jgi:hypothetical protein|uniref:PH domain-containing protein n=1 Tax=Streptomyces thermocoprophilus TaxID=78356 RepID=A0ABV5VAU1_9ACTN|nr:hypothetical protein [Streptomyces sp. XM83C]MCK1819089.1 hypothetical protein [Streptomyces sp. XM83C]